MLCFLAPAIGSNSKVGVDIQALLCKLFEERTDRSTMNKSVSQDLPTIKGGNPSEASSQPSQIKSPQVKSSTSRASQSSGGMSDVKKLEQLQAKKVSSEAKDESTDVGNTKEKLEDHKLMKETVVKVDPTKPLSKEVNLARSSSMCLCEAKDKYLAEEDCAEESSYAIYSDVTSAFAPIPKQKESGFLSPLRLKEDDTQSDSKKFTKKSNKRTKAARKESLFKKLKPRKIYRPLWERTLSPGLTPTRYRLLLILIQSRFCTCDLIGIISTRASLIGGACASFLAAGHPLLLATKRLPHVVVMLERCRFWFYIFLISKFNMRLGSPTNSFDVSQRCK
ncbi:unnamed protein product [Strongylus vulgaris]|uniref:Uncharacterized protein n=1 Tax=Strongylus vulgaris TaxID=40348 RepID=A0A3P7JBV8_STRVU|nr:unnamed protein product [Strongylus vulgaris]